jgi:hypothetical protein
MAEAEGVAADQLAETKTLPADLAGIDRIIAMLYELSKQNGRFKYLAKERMPEHRDALLAERAALAERTAVAMAAGYPRFPQTFDGFKQMALKSKEQQLQLESRGEPGAARALEQSYGQEAARRGSALLPVMIAEHRAVLNGELGNANYAKMPVLITIDEERAALAEYWKPPPNHPLKSEFNAYVSQRDDTAQKMVGRSQDQLIEWVGTLPVAQTTNETLREFADVTFRQAEVPSQFAKLATAIRDKRRAYNAVGFMRADISAALLNGQYGDMTYRGLEFGAYITTMMKDIGARCKASLEATMAASQEAIDDFIWNALRDGHERFMRGEYEDKNDMVRGVSVGIVNFMTRPGCTVNGWGTVISCTTEEQNQAAVDRAFHSGAGGADAFRLMDKGCEGLPQTYVRNLGEFAKTRPYSNPPQPLRLQAPWEFVRP